MRAQTRFRKALLCVLIPILGVPASVSAQPRKLDGVLSVLRADSPLEQCVGRQHKLSALFLVDESSSLTKTDPKDERVPALKAGARALNSLTRGTGEDAIKIDVALAGFGGSYIDRRTWGPLNDATLDGFLAEVDKQSEQERKNSIYTRYHVALSGAINSFVSHENDGSNCRLLIWFSDGKHDDDNDSKRYGGNFSPKEKSQISQVICGSNGYANEMRSQRIFVEAIGLNSNESDMALMRLVAEGQGVFNQGGVSVSRCGTLPALGSFGYAQDSSQIVDEFTNVPGSPRDEIKSGECEEATTNCSEIRFIADDAVVSFKAQITRPVEGVTSGTLTTGNGSRFELFGSQTEQKTSTIAVEKLTENKVLIDAHRLPSATLAGEWTIKFDGPSAREVVGRVKFLGDARLKVTDAKGKPLTKVDRFNTQDVLISADGNSGSTIVERLETSIRNSKEIEKLQVTTLGGGRFKLNAASLSGLLKEQFSDASAIELSVQPVGFVKGLEGVDGPVGVEFKPIRNELSVTNGKQLPQYIPAGPDDEPVVFNGTSQGDVTARFLGPDAGDGVVTWLNAAENDNGFELESPGKVCRVPRQQEVTCTVAIKPGKSGYGPLEVPIQAKLASATSGDERMQTVPVRVSMTRDADVGKGIKKAVLLFILFIAVQLAIRALFAAIISRFPAMSPTTRRARIAVRISADGTVSGEQRTQFSVSEGDEGFTFENVESCGDFELLGHHFACTPLRTFLRSTSSPRGRVTRGGYSVFGSAGTEFGRGNNRQGSETAGLVELSLRRQWVISISQSSVAELANGAGEATADLVAYLDPLDISDLESQLSDLELRVTSSQFAADLASALERVRVTESDDEVSSGPEGSGGTSSNTSDDPFEAASDPSPFDGAENEDPFQTALVEARQGKKEEKSRRSRRQKKQAARGNEAPAMQRDLEDPFGEMDPFA